MLVIYGVFRVFFYNVANPAAQAIRHRWGWRYFCAARVERHGLLDANHQLGRVGGDELRLGNPRAKFIYLQCRLTCCAGCVAVTPEVIDIGVYSTQVTEPEPSEVLR